MRSWNYNDFLNIDIQIIITISDRTMEYVARFVCYFNINIQIIIISDRTMEYVARHVARFVCYFNIDIR